MTKNSQNQAVTTLDVRDAIRAGREPFGQIMETAARLADGECLRLLAPFEPRPLFRVMALQGWDHNARAMDGGTWEVLFFRRPSAQPPTEFIELDLREASPPEMEAVILDRMTELGPGKALAVKTAVPPSGIAPFVEELGWTMQTCGGPGECFVTQIMPE